MATQSDPTTSDQKQKQIQGVFQKLAQGEAIFLPDKTYKSWYGIKNKTAVQKFKTSWEEFCRANKYPISQLYVGELFRRSGYVLVRKSDIKVFLQEL